MEKQKVKSSRDVRYISYIDSIYFENFMREQKVLEYISYVPQKAQEVHRCGLHQVPFLLSFKFGTWIHDIMSSVHNELPQPRVRLKQDAHQYLGEKVGIYLRLIVGHHSLRHLPDPSVHLQTM
jgi:hypothetical protein